MDFFKTIEYYVFYINIIVALQSPITQQYNITGCYKTAINIKSTAGNCYKMCYLLWLLMPVLLLMCFLCKKLILTKHKIATFNTVQIFKFIFHLKSVLRF